MKKKFFIGIAMSLFAVATVFNMNLSEQGNAGDVSLDAISVMAKAQGEGTGQDSTKKGYWNFDEVLDKWICIGDGSECSSS